MCALLSVFRNNRLGDQPCPMWDLSLRGRTVNRVVQMTILVVAVAVVSFFSLGPRRKSVGK